MLARPSAGIGVVEVQKPMFFLRFLTCSRDPLRGSARSRCKNHGFLRFLRCSRDPLRGSARSRCKNPWFVLRFLTCSRDPLRISARSRCKNLRFFATSVVRTGPRELSRGSRACSRNRRVAGSIPPWSAGGRRKMQLAFYSNLRRATCAEQVAQSNLRRPTCTDQFAQSALPRATCAEQLTQSNLRGATCAEQLAQCNLRRATCADQLAPTSLRRAPCLALSRACFTKCREKERILQRWADLACDVLLSGQPWSSFSCLQPSTGKIKVPGKTSRAKPTEPVFSYPVLRLTWLAWHPATGVRLPSAPFGSRGSSSQAQLRSIKLET